MKIGRPNRRWLVRVRGDITEKVEGREEGLIEDGWTE